MATHYRDHIEGKPMRSAPDGEVEHYGLMDGVLTLCGLLGFILIPVLIGALSLMLISTILRSLGFGGFLSF